MGAVLLTILKIIGIVLLSVIGLLVFVILIALFVPIRYRVYADCFEKEAVVQEAEDEEEEEKLSIKSIVMMFLGKDEDGPRKQKVISADAKITWLFRIIYAHAYFRDGKFVMKVRILGKLFFDNKDLGNGKVSRDDEGSGQGQGSDEKAAEKVQETSSMTAEAVQETSGMSAEAGKKTSGMSAESGQETSEKTAEAGRETDSMTAEAEQPLGIETNPEAELPYGESVETSDNEGDEEAEGSGGTIPDRGRLATMLQSFTEKVKKIFTAIKGFFQKIKDVFSGIMKTIKSLLDKYELIRGFFEDKRNKAAFSLIWQQLQRLGRNVRPRKVRGFVRFGTGDPCSTGKVLGLISTEYGAFGDKLDIYPNFMEKTFEGRLLMKGRMHLVVVVRIAWKLWRDKNIKYLRRSFAKTKAALR